MERASSKHLALATAILALETRERGAAADPSDAIEGAFRRLHDVMAKLIGSAGYNALLLRAIHLVRGDRAWLGALEVVGPPFALLQLREQVAMLGAPAAHEGATSLLATLLDLFAAFIGEELTRRQVAQAWSELVREAVPTSPEENR